MAGRTRKQEGLSNRTTPAQHSGQGDDGSLPNQRPIEQNRPFQRSSQPVSQSSSQRGTGLAGFAEKIQREKRQSLRHHHRPTHQQEANAEQPTHQQEANAVIEQPTNQQKEQGDEVSYYRAAKDVPCLSAPERSPERSAQAWTYQPYTIPRNQLGLGQSVKPKPCKVCYGKEDTLEKLEIKLKKYKSKLKKKKKQRKEMRSFISGMKAKINSFTQSISTLFSTPLFSSSSSSSSSSSEASESEASPASSYLCAVCSRPSGQCECHDPQPATPPQHPAQSITTTSHAQVASPYSLSAYVKKVPQRDNSATNSPLPQATSIVHSLQVHHASDNSCSYTQTEDNDEVFSRYQDTAEGETVAPTLHEEHTQPWSQVDPQPENTPQKRRRSVGKSSHAENEPSDSEKHRPKKRRIDLLTIPKDRMPKVQRSQVDRNPAFHTSPAKVAPEQEESSQSSTTDFNTSLDSRYNADRSSVNTLQHDQIRLGSRSLSKPEPATTGTPADPHKLREYPHITQRMSSIDDSTIHITGDRVIRVAQPTVYTERLPEEPQQQQADSDSNRGKKKKTKEQKKLCRSKEYADTDTVNESCVETETGSSRKKKLKKKRRGSRTSQESTDLDAQDTEKKNDSELKSEKSKQKESSDKKDKEKDRSEKKADKDRKLSETAESEDKKLKDTTASEPKKSTKKKAKCSVDSDDSDVPLVTIAKKNAQRMANRSSTNDSSKQTRKPTNRVYDESSPDDEGSKTPQRTSRRAARLASSSQASDEDEVFASPRRSSRLHSKNMEHDRKRKNMKDKIKHGAVVELSSEDEEQCTVVIMTENSGADKGDPCKISVVKESDEFRSRLMEVDKALVKGKKWKDRSISSSRGGSVDSQRTLSVSSEDSERKRRESVNSTKDLDKQKTDASAKGTSVIERSTLEKVEKEKLSEKTRTMSESSVSSQNKSSKKKRSEKKEKKPLEDANSHMKEVKSSRSDKKTSIKDTETPKLEKLAEETRRRSKRSESLEKDFKSSWSRASEAKQDSAVRAKKKAEMDTELEKCTKPKKGSKKKSDKDSKSTSEENVDSIEKEDMDLKTDRKSKKKIESKKNLDATVDMAAKKPEKHVAAEKETKSSEKDDTTNQNLDVACQPEQTIECSPENKENKPERSNGADVPTSRPSTPQGRFVIPKKSRASQASDSTEQSQEEGETRDKNEENHTHHQSDMLTTFEPGKPNSWSETSEINKLKKMSAHSDIAPTNTVPIVQVPVPKAPPAPRMCDTEKLLICSRLLDQHQISQAISNKAGRKVRDRLIKERDVKLPSTDEVSPPPRQWNTKLSDDEDADQRENRPATRSVFEERAILKSDRHQDLKEEIKAKRKQDVAQHLQTALRQADTAGSTQPEKEVFMDTLKLSPRKPAQQLAQGLYGAYTTSKDSAKIANPGVSRAVQQLLLRRSPRKSVRPQLFQSHEAGGSNSSAVQNIMGMLTQSPQQPTTAPCVTPSPAPTASDVMKLLKTSKTPETPKPPSKAKTPGNDTLDRIYDNVSVPPAITPLKPTPPDGQNTPTTSEHSTALAPVLQLIPLAPQPQNLTGFKIPKLLPKDPRQKPTEGKSVQGMKTRDPRLIPSEPQGKSAQELKARDSRQQPAAAQARSVQEFKTLEAQQSVQITSPKSSGEVRAYTKGGTSAPTSSGKAKSSLTVTIEKPVVPLPSAQALFAPARQTAQFDAMPSPASVGSCSPSLTIDMDRDSEEDWGPRKLRRINSKDGQHRAKQPQKKGQAENQDNTDPRKESKEEEGTKHKTNESEDKNCDNRGTQILEGNTKGPTSQLAKPNTSPPSPVTDTLWDSAIGGGCENLELGGEESLSNMYDDVASVNLSEKMDEEKDENTRQQQPSESKTEQAKSSKPVVDETGSNKLSKESKKGARDEDPRGRRKPRKDSSDYYSNDKQRSKRDYRERSRERSPNRKNRRERSPEYRRDRSPRSRRDGERLRLDSGSSREGYRDRSRDSQRSGPDDRDKKRGSNEIGPVKQEETKENIENKRTESGNLSREQEDKRSEQYKATTEKPHRDEQAKECVNDERKNSVEEGTKHQEIPSKGPRRTSHVSVESIEEGMEQEQSVEKSSNISTTTTEKEKSPKLSNETLQKSDKTKEPFQSINSQVVENTDTSNAIDTVNEAHSAEKSNEAASGSENSDSDSDSSSSDEEKDVITVESGSDSSSESDTDSDDNSDSSSGSSSSSSSSSEDSDSDKDDDGKDNGGQDDDDRSGSGSSSDSSDNSGDSSDNSGSSDSSSDEKEGEDKTETDSAGDVEQMEVTDKAAFCMVNVSPPGTTQNKGVKASPRKKSVDAPQTAAMKQKTPKKVSPQENQFRASVAPSFHPSPEKYRSPLKNFKALLTPRKLDAASYSPGTRARMQELGAFGDSSEGSLVQIVDCDKEGQELHDKSGKSSEKNPSKENAGEDCRIQQTDSNDAEVSDIMENKQEDTEVSGGEQHSNTQTPKLEELFGSLSTDSDEKKEKQDAPNLEIQESTEEGELKDDSQDGNTKVEETEKRKTKSSSPEDIIALHANDEEDSMFNIDLQSSHKAKNEEPENTDNTLWKRKPHRQSSQKKRGRSGNRARTVGKSPENDTGPLRERQRGLGSNDRFQSGESRDERGSKEGALKYRGQKRRRSGSNQNRKRRRR